MPSKLRLRICLEKKMHLSDLQEICYNTSLESGWWSDPHPYIIPTKLCLIHSEISEAMEGHRKGKQDDHLPHRSSLEVELADAIIRILDLAGRMSLDLEGAIMEKLEYNSKRADHKPENRMAAGGKKY